MILLSLKSLLSKNVSQRFPVFSNRFCSRFSSGHCVASILLLFSCSLAFEYYYKVTSVLFSYYWHSNAIKYYYKVTSVLFVYHWHTTACAVLPHYSNTTPSAETDCSYYLILSYYPLLLLHTLILPPHIISYHTQTTLYETQKLDSGHIISHCHLSQCAFATTHHIHYTTHHIPHTIPHTTLPSMQQY